MRPDEQLVFSQVTQERIRNPASYAQVIEKNGAGYPIRTDDPLITKGRRRSGNPAVECPCRHLSAQVALTRRPRESSVYLTGLSVRRNNGEVLKNANRPTSRHHRSPLLDRRQPRSAAPSGPEAANATRVNIRYGNVRFTSTLGLARAFSRLAHPRSHTGISPI